LEQVSAFIGIRSNGQTMKTSLPSHFSGLINLELSVEPVYRRLPQTAQLFFLSSMTPDSSGATPAQPVVTNSHSTGGVSLDFSNRAWTGLTSNPVTPLSRKNCKSLFEK
jgi:hypothetical protein